MKMKSIVECIKNAYSQVVEGMLVCCGILVPCPVKIEAEDNHNDE